MNGRNDAGKADASPLTKKRREGRHEVLIQRDGRWIIESVVMGEEAAVAHAEALLAADEAIMAVRVVRERVSKDGLFLGTTVFEKGRTGRPGAAPITLSSAPDEDAWCESIEDFYGAASRRAMGRLLRQFLDRLGITQTELLYNHRFYKKLDTAGNLEGAALHRMAQLQSDARAVESRARRQTLDGFVRDAAMRARDALALRGVPRLEGAGLTAFLERMRAYVVDENERAYLTRHGLCRWLEDMNGHQARFEAMLKLAEPDLPAAARPLIDELLADLCGAAAIVQDLLGNQPHLAAALSTLADFATIKWEAGGGPAAPRLARLLRDHGLPETRIVLLDRLRRELAGDRPLSRDDNWGQAALLQKLIGKLTDERGLFVGGGAMVDAIARRQRRLDVVGGIEPARFAAREPDARLRQLAAAAHAAVADGQKNALATYMVEILDGFEGDAMALLPLRELIAASALPAGAKQAVLDRLPRPTQA